jgi:hypothetical protein
MQPNACALSTLALLNCICYKHEHLNRQESKAVAFGQINGPREPKRKKEELPKRICFNYHKEVRYI